MSEFLALSEHPPSLPPASGVRPEHALRYGPGDPVDPAGATCRRIKPREHRLTCAQAWAARLDKGRADIDSQTAVDPAWEEHLARGPVDEHEAICRSSAVLRCIAAGRSASVCEGHNAGEQVVSKTILTSGPHQRSRSHLVRGLFWTASFFSPCAVPDRCRSHRSSRIKPIPRWKFYKRSVYGSCLLPKSSSV